MMDRTKLLSRTPLNLCAKQGHSNVARLHNYDLCGRPADRVWTANDIKHVTFEMLTTAAMSNHAISAA